MAHGRISADAHYVSGERVLALQFAAAIFRQNNFHGWIYESVSEARPQGRAIHGLSEALPYGRASDTKRHAVKAITFRSEMTEAALADLPFRQRR